MKFKKIVSLLAILPFSIFGQVAPFSKVEIKSPQSYAFDKYGNVPVKLYTGAIDLQIPITSIPIYDNKKIDVQLSYDSSGFIPHKKSDLAGMNWSLMAGGSITRVMNYIPDEYISTQILGPSSPFQPGEFDFHGFYAGVKRNSYTNENAYNLSSGGVGYSEGDHWFIGPRNDSYEGEPDLFRFSIMGLYGEFMIGFDGKPKVKSNDPNLKVDLSGFIAHASKGCTIPYSEIILIDGEGTKYYFGGDLSKSEISFSQKKTIPSKDNAFGDFAYINSFSISKIVFNNNKTILFNYENPNTPFSYDYCGLYTTSNIQNVKNNSKLFSFDSFYQDGASVQQIYDCPGGFFQGCFQDIVGQSQPNIYYTLLKKSLLQSIEFENYKIQFSYKDTGYPIQQVENGSGIIYLNEFVIDKVETFFNTTSIKKTTFEYQDLGGTHKRPFLSKLYEQTGEKNYTFEYYDTANLPPYYTKGIDHWGYWNGNDSNTQLTVNDTYNTTTGDYTLNNTLRDANTSKASVGLLKKIVYPTKGYTIFEYEPHYYSKRIERNSSSAFLPTLTNNGGICGGARIKKQIDYDDVFPPTEPRVKEYKYTNNYSSTVSSGILMNWPRYLYYFESTSAAGINIKKIITSSSNVQQNSLDSYNVGYAKVYEIDGSGYIEHNYTNYESFPDKLLPDTNNLKECVTSFGPSSPVNLYKNYRNLYGNDTSELRGRELLQRIYTSGGTLKKQTEYFYNDLFNFNSSLIDDNNYVTIHHLSGLWVQAYKKFFNSFSLNKTIETSYLPSGNVTITNRFDYNSPSHLNLTSKNVSNSKTNEVIETKYFYPQDTQMASKPFRNELITKNIVGNPLVTQTYRGIEKLSEQETTYSNDANSNNLLLAKSLLSSKNNLPAETKITYNNYDVKGNVTQYTQENGMPVTVLWGHNKTLPIAKIENATLTQVSSALGTDSITLQNNSETYFTSINGLRSTMSNVMITTYTYLPLIGIRTITDPKGDTTSFTYDEFNRLKNVKDKNGNILSENRYHFKN